MNREDLDPKQFRPLRPSFTASAAARGDCRFVMGEIGQTGEIYLREGIGDKSQLEYNAQLETHSTWKTICSGQVSYSSAPERRYTFHLKNTKKNSVARLQEMVRMLLFVSPRLEKGWKLSFGKIAKKQHRDPDMEDASNL